MYKLIPGIIIWMLGISVSVIAQNRTHVIQSGETLYSIAREYNVTVQNLKEWNNLQTNELSIGQKLVVNQRSSDRTITHIVKAQETLFSISKKYNVNISEIRSWNGLSGNNLRIGQELVIHQKENDDKDSQSSGSSIVVTNPAQSNTYYTVKSGDTLYGIARAHDMTVDEITELNNLRSNTLSIGQRLTVKANSAPPSVATSAEESFPQGKFLSYRAESTLSLDQLLEKFQMTEAEFKALNPEFSSNSLPRGKKATVLVPATITYSNPYLTNTNLQSLGDTRISRYSASEEGKTTTNGELYNAKELTAAHSNIAMGTIIYIQNPQNNRGVYVRINDRISGSGLKLSDKAWKALDVSSSNPSVQIFQE